MSVKRIVPVNLAVIALTAVLCQAEAKAKSPGGEANRSKQKQRSSAQRHRSRRVAGRRGARQGVRQLSSMRQRALLYEPYIVEASRKYRVDPRVLWTIAYLETRFRPLQVSPAGARGLMQLMSGTASRFSVSDPFDSRQAIDGAAQYVAKLTSQFGSRLDLVLASYNAGEGAVDCYLNGRTVRDTSTGRLINPRGIKTGGIPPYAETDKYVKRGLLVFSRITSAGVFAPDLIAQSRQLQAPPTSIPAIEQRIVDRELAELGGPPATMLLATVGGTLETGSGGVRQPSPPVKATVDGAKNSAAVSFETVFFDIHSGVRYLVRDGQIVRPVEEPQAGVGVQAEADAELLANGSGNRSQTRSYYAGGGGRE